MSEGLEIVEQPVAAEQRCAWEHLSLWTALTPFRLHKASSSRWIWAVRPLSKRANDAVLDLDLAYVRAALPCFPLWVHTTLWAERQGGVSLRYQICDYKAMSDVLSSAGRITSEKPQILCSRAKCFCQALSVCLVQGRLRKRIYNVCCFKSLSFRDFIQE